MKLITLVLFLMPTLAFTAEKAQVMGKLNCKVQRTSDKKIFQLSQSASSKAGFSSIQNVDGAKFTLESEHIKDSGFMGVNKTLGLSFFIDLDHLVGSRDLSYVFFENRPLKVGEKIGPMSGQLKPLLSGTRIKSPWLNGATIECEFVK